MSKDGKTYRKPEGTFVFEADRIIITNDEIKNNCKLCPHLKLHERSLDDFTSGEDWICTKANLLIAVYVSWDDNEPEIPEWCPIKVEEKP